MPFNAAIGGFNTFLPLYIILLGGSVIDVGLAASAFNFALIPGSLFWGRLADATPSRRAPLTYACVALSLLFGITYLTKVVAVLIFLNALFGFVSGAFSPTSQLLLMETFPKSQWSKMFARISGISFVGLVIGVFPGIIWTRFFELSSYVLYCLSLSVVTGILVSLLVREPAVIFERQALIQILDAFIERMRQVPLFFVSLPRLSDIGRFARMIRIELTRELPLVYTAMFLFFLSTSLFFTSYTPFLKSRDIPDFDVFLIYFSLFLTNALLFFGASALIAKLGEIRSAQAGFLLRALCMAVSGVLALGMSGERLIFASVIVLSTIGLTFTLTSTAITAIVYRRLEVARRGELLGFYSALVAAAFLIGSMLSGYSSFQFNYQTTFLAGAVVLLLGSAVLRISQKSS